MPRGARSWPGAFWASLSVAQISSMSWRPHQIARSPAVMDPVHDKCMTSAWLSNTECFPLALKISNTPHSMMTNAVGAGIKFESSLLAVVSCGMGSSPRIFSRHGLRTGNGWKDAVQALSFLLEPLRHTWCWTFTFVIICRCRGGKHWLKSVTNTFHDDSTWFHAGIAIWLQGDLSNRFWRFLEDVLYML